MKTLFQSIREAGIPYSNHESDLSVRVRSVLGIENGGCQMKPTAQHTPGVLSMWLCQSSGRPPRLDDRIGDRVCTFNDSHPRTKEFQALLAAAPELLDELKAQLENAEGDLEWAEQSHDEDLAKCFRERIKSMRAAIAKAEGRT